MTNKCEQWRHLPLSYIQCIEAENARLRNLLRTVLKSCDADAYGYYIYEFPQETYDAVREVLGDE